MRMIHIIQNFFNENTKKCGENYFAVFDSSNNVLIKVIITNILTSRNQHQWQKSL